MATIAESELILNPRGAVYHLDLLPEEISHTIITVGDPERVAEVSKYFDHIEVQRQKREFVTHTGTIGGRRLTVISTGIGTDNIDIVFSELDALVNIDLKTRAIKAELTQLRIFRIGTAGALQADIPVGSFVVSESAIGMDNLLNFYQLAHPPVEKEMLLAFLSHVQENHIGFIPYIAGCSPSLLASFDHETIKGVTITCPGFYGPQGRILRAALAFPQLINNLSSFTFGGHRIANFEMETAGVYGMARLLGHEAISVSAIVANRVEKKISKDKTGAIERLIRYTLEKVIGI